MTPVTPIRSEHHHLETRQFGYWYILSLGSYPSCVEPAHDPQRAYIELNETSYLGSIDSSSWPIHHTWSTDNSKMAIGEIWATGIYTPGPINIFDTKTPLVFSISDEKLITFAHN